MYRNLKYSVLKFDTKIKVDIYKSNVGSDFNKTRKVRNFKTIIKYKIRSLKFDCFEKYFLKVKTKCIQLSILSTNIILPKLIKVMKTYRYVIRAVCIKFIIIIDGWKMLSPFTFIIG